MSPVAAVGALASHRRSTVFGTVAPVTSFDFTFSAAVEPFACTGVTAARGTTLVAVIHIRSGAATNTTTVTDAAGNTWTQQGNVDLSGTNSRVAVFTAPVVTALSAQTVTIDGGASFIAYVNISVWSGVGSVGSVNANSAAATTTPAALAVTAPEVGDVVISAISYGSATAPTAYPSGYSTLGVPTSPGTVYYGAQAYKQITTTGATGSQSPAWTIPSTGSATINLVLRPGPFNYLANASFEAGATLATSWTDEHTTSNTITYSLVAATAGDGGTKAQRFLYDGSTSTNTGSQIIEIYQNTLPASFAAGDNATFSVWISGTLANTYVFIGIEAFTSGNVYLAEVDYIFNPTTTTQKYTVRFPNLPATTDHVAVYLQCPGLTTTSTVDLTLDGARLVRA